MNDDIEKRLIDLEVRYTHQEDLLMQLNEVVGKQGQIIDKLKAELKELKLNSSQSDRSMINEKPPHY